MRKNLYFIIALLLANFSFAQGGGFNYKALLTDNGSVLNNHSVTFKFTVLENGSTAVYQETQTAITDANGIVAVNVGEGTLVSGNFTTIDWGSNPYFLKVEIDTGNGYQDFGTTEFKAVPYAKFAEKAGNAFSGDFSALSNVPAGLSNGDDDTHLTEAQVDNYVSNNGYLTQVDNIRGIPVSSATPNNGQVLKYNGSQFVPADDDTSGGSGTDGVVNSAAFSGTSTKTLTLARSNGLGNITANFTDNDTHLTDAQIATMGYIKNANDADHDATNEIQNLTLNSTQLSISNGNNVNFTGWDTDASDDFDGNFSSLSNVPTGLSDGDDDTHLTDAQIGAMGYIKNANDADHDATNEIQTLSVNSNQLTISQGNTVTLPAGVTKLDDLSDARSDSNGSSIFIGSGAGANDDQSDNRNIGIGFHSLQSNTTGETNIAQGYRALNSNTTGNGNTAVGDRALMNNTTGNYNTANGGAALLNNTIGRNNIANGSDALFSNTSGSYNIAIGSDALFSNTSGEKNIANGSDALANNTTGNYNVGIGNRALLLNTTGNSNVAIGIRALYYNTDRSNLVAVGDSALYNNGTNASYFIEATNNTAIGSKALYSNTTGFANTANGYLTLYSNTIGSFNTANGNNALHTNTTGGSNTANGNNALFSNTTGDYNTATGNEALYSNTTGAVNTAYGHDALHSNTSGSANNACGSQTLYDNTTGWQNTANGDRSLNSNTTGWNNTASGYEALGSNSTGNSNVAIGIRALYKNTDRSNLVAVGDSALYNNGTGASNSNDAVKNTAIGSKALYSNTTGNSNTAIGYNALITNTAGHSNTASGTSALSSNTTGFDNTASGRGALSSNTTGFKNTASGRGALSSNTTGYGNTANGSIALYNNTTGIGNTASGNGALIINTSGDNNVALGYEAGYNLQSGSGNVFVGYNAGYFETGSNKLYIDNSSTSEPLIYGDFNTDELTINGKLEVTDKITAPGSGNADLKAYVYGFIYYDANIDNAKSAGGFAIQHAGTGIYRITLYNVPTNDWNYIVSATAEIGGSGTPVIATTDYVGTSGHQNEFYIKIYNLSGGLVDNSFHFVVYRK